VYQDVTAMLEKEQPDVVDICTPPQTHASLAVQALQAGSHVLIEKPMAVSVEECDRIIRVAEETGRRVCVAHSDLFYPAFMRARALVAKGAIGTFTGMHIFLATPVDYITSKPDHWAHRLPGGVLGETGPHTIYLTLAFINPIRDVQIHGHKMLSEYPWSPFEDYRFTLIGDQAVSSVALTYTTDQWAAKVDLWGTQGIIRVDLESQSLIHYRRPSLKGKTIGFSALREAWGTVTGTLLHSPSSNLHSPISILRLTVAGLRGYNSIGRRGSKASGLLSCIARSGDSRRDGHERCPIPTLVAVAFASSPRRNAESGGAGGVRGGA